MSLNVVIDLLEQVKMRSFARPFSTRLPHVFVKLKDELIESFASIGRDAQRFRSRLAHDIKP